MATQINSTQPIPNGNHVLPNGGNHSIPNGNDAIPEVNHAITNGDHAARPDLDYDGIVIGAGFGGLRMLYELRRQGLTGRVFEAGSGVGGTWYWNRYPGARTDSESWVYIFTFLEQIGMDWSWKERFPQQPEVEEYLNKMTDFLDLRKDIQLKTKITAAHRDEKLNAWRVTTQHGEEFTCQYLVSAVGPLAAPLDPPFPGLASFKGEWYQTGLWPKNKVDFAGKRVAVIGTGATGVQIIPMIAHGAKHLTVFQRTPNYVMPARNHPLSEEQSSEINRDYETILKRARNQAYGFDMIDSPIKYDDVKNDPKMVQRVLEKGWEKGGFRYLFETFGDVLLSPESNEAASDFVRQKIRAIVEDQKTAELLCPNYPVGSKRPPAGHHYFETFNRPNVELVDIKNDPIRDITPTGLRTDSKEFEFDMIVFAIGFDAITGTLGKIDIRSTDDVAIGDIFKQKMETNHGITLAGFPNFFMIFGPLAPFANGPLIIDAVADWVGKTIAHMRATGHDRVECTPEAAKQWKEHVNELFEATVVAQSAKDVGAWIVGANVKGKERTPLFYYGGVPAYITACDKEISDNYPGHVFSASPAVKVA